MGAGGLLLPAEDDSAIARIFGYEVAYKIITNEEYPRHITSANAMYKRAVFEALGPCTRQLGESSFDSEYNSRILQQGWKLKVNKQALAWHHFKSGFTDCLRRTFWYGFRRPYVKSQVLYPADRWLGILVLFSSLLVPALCLLPIFPLTMSWLVLLLLVIHFLYSLSLFRYFKYRTLLIAFPLFLLRNSLFFYAYLSGWANYLLVDRKQ